MSAAVALLVRILGLFGVSLSPFVAGAVLAAVIAAGAGLFGLHLYNAGYASADSAWQAKALQSQIDALVADRDLARRALGDERLRTAAIELQSTADKEGTAVYVEQLKTSFAAACALNDADIDFLRKRAGPGRGQARAAGAGGWIAAHRPRAAIPKGR